MSLKRRINAGHKAYDIEAEFGDLGLEDNRIAYINALILNSVVPPLWARDRRLEASIFQIERGAMHEIVSTFSKLAKAHCKRASIMLKGLEDRYVTQDR